MDELGTRAEADLAQYLANEGVSLIATTHGRSIDDILHNPDTNGVVGGIVAVTVGDEAARYELTV